MSDAPNDPQLVELEPTTVAVLRETITMDAISDYYDRAFGTVAGVVAEQGVGITGPALGLYFGMPADTVDLGAGFPVDAAISPSDGVTTIELPTGRAAQLLHAGSYDELGQAYERLTDWMSAQGLAPGSTMWESYLTEPTPDADPADMRTLITWTVQD